MSAPLPVCDLLTEQEWAIVCAIRSHDGGMVDGEISRTFYRWAETGIMRMPPTAAERERRTERSRLGGLARAATATTAQEITQAARDKLWAKYLDQVPADVTDPDERMRQAGELRRTHMARLSALAREARQAKRETGAARP